MRPNALLEVFFQLVINIMVLIAKVCLFFNCAKGEFLR